MRRPDAGQDSRQGQRRHGCGGRDWTLTATGYDAASPDAGTYALSESGPDGYTLTSLTCDNSTGPVTSVTLGLGEDVTCTFVNDDIAPTLKLVKEVINDNDRDATPDNWDLCAETDEPSDRDFCNLGGSGVFETVHANAAYVLSEGTHGRRRTMRPAPGLATAVSSRATP